MGFYIVLLFLCFYLLFVLVEGMLQIYFDEFNIDKTQPLTIDLVKKVINLFVEKRIFSKFKKPLSPVPSPSTDFYSVKAALYFIFTGIVCGIVGFITGRKYKKSSYHNEQDINNRNGPMSSYNSSDNNESSTCSLCLNVFKPQMVLLPCKHICMCTNCWTTFYQESQHNCPICREDIEEVMNVYST